MSAEIVGRNWVQRLLSVSRRVWGEKRQMILHTSPPATIQCLWRWAPMLGYYPGQSVWWLLISNSSQWEGRRCGFNPKVGLVLMCRGIFCGNEHGRPLLCLYHFLGGGWAIRKAGAGLTRKWYLKSRRRLWQDHHISLSHVPLLHITTICCHCRRRLITFIWASLRISQSGCT